VGLLCLCHILDRRKVGDGLCLEIMELSPTARITARGERCNSVYICPLNTRRVFFESMIHKERCNGCPGSFIFTASGGCKQLPVDLKL